MYGKIIDKTYVKKEKESGKLRMGGGSWSIPVRVLSRVNEVVYTTETAEYTISVDKALNNGYEIATKQGEQKLVVPVKQWEFRKVSTIGAI